VDRLVPDAGAHVQRQRLLGRLDLQLQPFYERDIAAGILTDDEAIFHVACMYLKETGYIQLGGPDAEGNDVTSRVSFICLEAAHRIRIRLTSAWPSAKRPTPNSCVAASR